jgi:DNA-binding XRE family transcriptional regulator
VATTPQASEREFVYNRLPLLRADRGISRGQLAEALGIHYQTVGYLERGEYSPSLHLALRIARYFDLPIEAVFSLEPFGRLGADALLPDPAGGQARPSER